MVKRELMMDENDPFQSFISLQYKPGNSKLIEVLKPYKEIEILFDRIKEQWVSIGDVEPYYSVSSHEKFLSKNLDSNLKEFHDSGKQGIGSLLGLCEKNAIQCPNGILFELGCGVGRSTQHFSPAFNLIHAWDVSSGNLRECEKNLGKIGVTNVHRKLIQNITDYDAIPLHDAFFSEIVIQHNPPPLQYYMLDKVLSKLKPGGVFYFQTITHHPSYYFTVENYLNWKHNQNFEMHALPMRWVIQVIRKNGLLLLDVLKDRHGGFGNDSNTFFGMRP